MITIDLKKLAVAFAVALAVSVAVGAAWFYTKEFFKPRAAADEAKKEVTVELEPFVVNLGNQSSGRYLRASVSLVLGAERDRQAIKESSSRIRDGLIVLLASKSADALLTAPGKTELRTEIVEQVNAAAGARLVEAVYFREFLIQ